MTHEISIVNGVAEAAFSVTPPWHGLGKVLGDNVNSEEILKAASLEWKVEKIPVYVKDNQGNYQELKGYKAIAREDTGYIFNVATDRYIPIQNDEACKLLDELSVQESLKYESAISLRHGSMIVFLARMPKVDTILQEEELYRYAMLSIRHDAKGSIVIMPTNVRVVCMNTYRLALSHAKSVIKIVHKGNVKNSIRKAIQTLRSANEQLLSFAKAAEELAKTKINEKLFTEILDEFLPEHPKYPKRVNKMRKEVYWRFFDDPNQQTLTTKRTAWGVFCAFTAAIDHFPIVDRRGKTIEAKKMARFNTSLFSSGHQLKKMVFDRLCELSDNIQPAIST